MLRRCRKNGIEYMKRGIINSMRHGAIAASLGVLMLFVAGAAFAAGGTGTATISPSIDVAAGATRHVDDALHRRRSIFVGNDRARHTRRLVRASDFHLFFGRIRDRFERRRARRARSRDSRQDDHRFGGHARRRSDDRYRVRRCNRRSRRPGDGPDRRPERR